ncbi:ABC transporter ATP-binding protein [Paenibacillus sp. y28]|uniref:ABC transporter ATP-binding protein n=1 Tax=Paenibacillus sp. y28 TaxID=3129110 RepID=UPI00301A9816
MNTVVEISGLRLKFPGDPGLLFQELSLTINRGEKVLLLGPSGCGKSTLLQVASGLIPETVEVPMKADRVQTPESWGYVFQDPDSQFCMPYVDEELAFVLENIQVPREEMPERIRGLLERVGLDLEDVHTPIRALSQGMKQRLAVASVLALEPQVLFLDEPTSMLDPEGTRQVWDTLEKAASRLTVIIVEHKLERVLDWVDRVILMNGEGRIWADGPPAELFSRYREQLMEYGIWYPGVWEDYAAGRSLPSRKESGNPLSGGYAELDAAALLVGDDAAGLRTCGSVGARGEASPIVLLERFEGLRGKQPAIEVNSASFGAGEWITMVGENGAGKSTLLLSLMQLVPTRGSYELAGQRVTAKTPLYPHLAYVFQNPEFQFVTDSVEDEIAFTLRRQQIPPQEIKRLTEAELERFALSAQRGKHPYQLSMGQKRRLSVASAIVGGQPVLLLDEPTFGQDARNTFAMLEQLERLRAEGVTVLMVTHDMEIVRHFATRVWTVQGGRLVSDTPAPRAAAGEAQEVSVL